MEELRNNNEEESILKLPKLKGLWSKISNRNKIFGGVALAVLSFFGIKYGDDIYNSVRGDLERERKEATSLAGARGDSLYTAGTREESLRLALAKKPTVVKETLEDQLLAIYAENPWTNVDISYQGDRANIGEYRGTPLPSSVKAWILTEDLRSRGAEFLENYNPAGKNFLDIYEVIQQLNGRIPKEVLEDIIRGKITEYLVVDSKFARNAFQYGEEGVDYGIVVRDGHYTSPHVLGEVRDYRRLNVNIKAPNNIPRKVNP